MNQLQFFAEHSNQSVHFILYGHKITSVLFSCLSRSRNLKLKGIFPYILICYYIKQIDSMFPCICSVTGHRGRQNVVRTSVTHSAAPRVPLFLFLPHFDVICDLLLNRRTATWNLFVIIFFLLFVFFFWPPFMQSVYDFF